MIEPYRAIVDIIASRVANTNIELNKNQRCDLAHVLHNACVIDNKKTNILISIDLMINSNRKSAEKHFRRIGEFLPKTGDITALKLTEKQFENIIPLVGEMDKSEKIGKNVHIMI